MILVSHRPLRARQRELRAVPVTAESTCRRTRSPRLGGLDPNTDQRVDVANRRVGGPIVHRLCRADPMAAGKSEAALGSIDIAVPDLQARDRRHRIHVEFVLHRGGRSCSFVPSTAARGRPMQCWLPPPTRDRAGPTHRRSRLGPSLSLRSLLSPGFRDADSMMGHHRPHRSRRLALL